MPVSGYAQYDPAHIDTSAARTHGMHGFTTFDPSIYQVQKRYRPWEGDSAWAAEWWRHITVGASTGADVLHNYGDNGTTLQMPVNVSVGYQFNPIHELRLQGGFVSNRVQKTIDGSGDVSSAFAFNAELQYFANLTNFMYGYNPSRRWSVRTMVGVGTHVYNDLRGKNKDFSLEYNLTPYGKLGLDLVYRVSPNISFYVQPFFGLQRNQEGLFKGLFHDKYDVYGGVHSGFVANFEDSKKYYEELAPRFHSIFLEASTGWNFDMSNYDPKYSGNSYNFGIGRWVDPVFGFKFNLFGQQGYWNYDELNPKFRKSSVSVGGGAEVLFGVLDFFNKRKKSLSDPVFDLNVSAGVRFGYSAKYGAVFSQDEIDREGKYNVKKRPSTYYGFTGALQALLKISSGTYLFAEPRFSYYFYNEPAKYYSTDNGLKRSITDNGFMNLSLGTRIYAATTADRTLNDNDFTRNWWVSADLGGMKLYQAHRLMNEGLNIQPAVGMSVGYDVNPYASFRLQSQWQKYSRTTMYSGITTNYGVVDFRAMYMMSITNLMRGFDSHNRGQLYFETGPTFSINSGQYTEALKRKSRRRVGEFSPGWMAGMMMSLKVAPRWDLYSEVQGQYNFKEKFTAPYGNSLASTPGNVDKNDKNRDNLNMNYFSNLKYGLYIGTRYHFIPWSEEDHARLNFDVPEWMNGWFFEAGTGWTVPIDKFSAGKFTEFSGNQYKISFGRWVSPIFAFRAGIQGLQFYHDMVELGEGVRQYHSQLVANGHVELVTDVLNWFPSLRGEERKFDLNLFAGLVVGAQGASYNGYLSLGKEDFWKEMNVSFGYSAGLQALLRVAPGIQLYLEPSITSLRNSVLSHYNDRLYDDKTSMPFAISAGTRIMRPTDSRALRHAGYRGDDIEGGFNAKFEPSWWVGFELGGAKTFRGQKLVNDNNNGLNVVLPTFGMSVAREFTPISTLRAQFEGSFMYRPSLSDNGYKHYSMYDGRLMYMLNFTNLWRGTRNQPKFSLYPEIGVAMSYKNYARFKDDENNAQYTAGVVAGMMGALRVAQAWDLTAESQIQHNFAKGYMNSYRGNKVNQKWNLTFGTRYHVPEDKTVRHRLHLDLQDWQKAWYVETSAGWARPFEHNSGNIYNISVGRWISSMFGLRLGVLGQQSYYGDPKKSGKHVTMYNAQVLKAGHIELVTDVFNWFPSVRENNHENRLFGLNLYGGINAGRQSSYSDKYDNEPNFTIGYTAGAQLLLRVAPSVYVYAEPSVNTLQNKIKKKSTTESEVNSVFALSVGSRIIRSNDSKSLRKAGYNGESLEGGFQASFKPNWWASIQMGGSKNYLAQKYISDQADGIVGIQPTISLNGGRDFTSVSSVRAQLETSIMYLNDKKWTDVKHFNMTDVRLLYMLNLTNLWRGTRNTPAFSMYPEVGVGYSFKTKCTDTYPKNTSFDLVAGMMASLRVSDKFDLTAESQVQHYFTDDYISHSIKAKSNERWNFTLGLRYHFRDKK